jgi:hypothetical protein
MAKKKGKRKPHSEVRWATIYQSTVPGSTLPERFEVPFVYSRRQAVIVCKEREASEAGFAHPPKRRIMKVRITEITNARKG